MRPLVALLPFIVGAMSIPGCTKQGPGLRTPKSPVSFGTESARVGDRERTAYTTELDLTYALPYEGERHHRFVRSARYECEVLEVDDGVPVAMRVAYEHGREAMVDSDALEDDETRVRGNRYLVRYEDTDLHLDKEGGSKRHPAETMQLGIDFTWFGSPGALRAQLRGKALAVGERVQLSPGELLDRFTEPDPSAPARSGDSSARPLSLRLAGVRQHCGREIAVFDAAVTLTTEFPDGYATADLTGRAEFDIATAVPVSIALAGPVRVAEEVGEEEIGEGEAKIETSSTLPQCD